MINRIFPPQLDNRFRGLRLAFLPFGLLIAMKLMIGVNSMINTYSVATGADGIALDSFPPAASREILEMFALLGLGQLILAVLGVVVLVRYRAMVPLYLALLMLERLIRYVLIPIDLTGLPVAGLAVTLLTPALIVAGLVLSLWPVDRNRPISSA